jgi:hypothetical protein
MSQNGISTLVTKQLKQEAKLSLAQTKRQTVSDFGFRTLNVLDSTMLPTLYSGDIIVDNPNVTGLLDGRPWHT